MNEPTLYLASASPRRRQLLSDAGIAFVQHIVPIDEDALTTAYTGPLDCLGEYLACRKAEAARRDLIARGKAGLVLASDTTVLFDGRSLPKPTDAADAVMMLQALRGKEHIVATGVALAETASGTISSATSRTRVRMRDYPDRQIQAYVASGDPMDKAGAYSIQHPGFHPVASFTGCYPGVVGLPICIVAALLGHGALSPLGPKVETATASGASCIWSARCRLPFPGPELQESPQHERRSR